MKYYFSVFLLPITFLFLPEKVKPTGTWGHKPDQTPTTNQQYSVPPGVSIADVRVVEGNSGQRTVEVMVTLHHTASSPVTVAFRTKDITASAGSDYASVSGYVNFVKGEFMKKIVVTVNGDITIEADETLEIVLSSASGATIADSIGTVIIVNDDLKGGSLSFYEVRLTYIGYTTFAGTPTDCPIRSNGKVVLAGLVSGNEKVNADEDIRYTGVLQLDIDIDICSSKTVEDPQGGYPPCGISVLGSGLVKTELEIYYDQRGGYIKTENQSGKFIKVLFGSCDAKQINDETDMVPNKSISSVFNGTELPMLTNRTLRVGRYVESNDGIEIVVEVLRAIKP